MNDPLEQSLIAYLHSRVSRLEVENEALKKEIAAIRNWAEEQRGEYVEMANEAGAFFDLFGE